MAFSRESPFGATLANGKALIAGGYTCSGFCDYAISSEVYDPATNSWSATGNMKDAHYYTDPEAILLSTGRCWPVAARGQWVHERGRAVQAGASGWRVHRRG